MSNPVISQSVPRPAGADVYVPPKGLKDGPNPVELLKSFQVDRADRAKDAKEADESEYQYFVRCFRGHPEPGIFLMGNPHGQVLGNKDWFSTYHRAGAPYQLDLYCQKCGDFVGDPDEPEYRGELFQLAGIDYQFTRKRSEVLFTIRPRWVWRYAKDPERRAEEGGSHRSTRMANVAMNDGLPERVRTTEVARG